MTFLTAAAAAGLERQALGDAVKRYNAEGLDSLYDLLRSGRPRQLTAAQEQELAVAISKGRDPETFRAGQKEDGQAAKRNPHSANSARLTTRGFLP
jgi:hypothetical protein